MAKTELDSLLVKAIVLSADGNISFLYPIEDLITGAETLCKSADTVVQQDWILKLVLEGNNLIRL